MKILGPAVAIFSALSLSATEAAHPSKAFQLTPELVVQLVLQRGSQAKKIDVQRQQKRVKLFEALKDLDLTLSSGINYKDSKADSLNPSANQEEMTLGIDFSASKNFSTGTQVLWKYERTSQSRVLGSLISSTANSDPVTLDVMTFEINQELWRDAFGKSQKIDIETAKIESQNGGMERLEALEQLTLDTMNTYWNAFVAKEHLQESLSARDRYNQLAKVVSRKAKLGYAAPGELSRILAEREDQEQNVKNRSAEYLNMIDQLEIQLKVEIPEDLDFVTPKILPPIPNLKPKQAKSLRPYKLAMSALKITQNNLESQRSQLKPKLSLITRAQLTGSGTEGSEALSDISTGNKPVYYLGVEWSQTFGSNHSKAVLEPIRLQKRLDELELENVEEQLQYQLNSQARDSKSKYLIAQSAAKTYTLHQTSARELERAYKQGRIQISDLIQVLNKLYTAQTKKTRAKGNYHISLNTWAATRDELVKSLDDKGVGP